ncbi:hypothetical protein [Actinokineospora globicatena]|uniref:Uncharacterized protein n=1 Tax=Actinokineospora globicatena TaxID=103729 RepID=A0A9W6QUD4_9PSEU|nr:hypothetical protein [Actinokineospora globicatena]GLW94749.1 hypothetical protein Aglo03_55650 [Actinokineospora globicatena]
MSSGSRKKKNEDSIGEDMPAPTAAMGVPAAIGGLITVGAGVGAVVSAAGAAVALPAIAAAAAVAVGVTAATTSKKKRKAE